ncbi:RNA-dependent RNA polymerase family protein [Paraburkholderia sediminicola]|uniref:hypothetical protein n=1 Tax=Paraburkholderia sediminicola TaxID=458836 RepID=UPI0038BACE88
MTEHRFNLVVPLAHEATAMRITDTDRQRAERSSAVSQLSDRSGDVDSTMVQLTPGIRTTTTATRTTTTRALSSARSPSADRNVEAEFSGTKLVTAYRDCRRTKRNSASALAFEANLERNIANLHDELRAGTYVPGRSKCFIITWPKPREVWAADFTDRVVQHLLYNHIGKRFEDSFIADSCACIKGRGTLYAVQRLESKIRSITQNWARKAFYLKCDIANFFVSIPKPLLLELFLKKIHEPFWRWLTEIVLMHDPRDNFDYLGDRALMRWIAGTEGYRHDEAKNRFDYATACSMVSGAPRNSADALSERKDRGSREAIRAPRFSGLCKGQKARHFEIGHFLCKSGIRPHGWHGRRELSLRQRSGVVEQRYEGSHGYPPEFTAHAVQER